METSRNEERRQAVMACGPVRGRGSDRDAAAMRPSRPTEQEMIHLGGEAGGRRPGGRRQSSVIVTPAGQLADSTGFTSGGSQAPGGPAPVANLANRAKGTRASSG